MVLFSRVQRSRSQFSDETHPAKNTLAKEPVVNETVNYIAGSSRGYHRARTLDQDRYLLPSLHASETADAGLHEAASSRYTPCRPPARRCLTTKESSTGYFQAHQFGVRPAPFQISRVTKILSSWRVLVTRQDVPLDRLELRMTARGSLESQHPASTVTRQTAAGLMPVQKQRFTGHISEVAVVVNL